MSLPPTEPQHPRAVGEGRYWLGLLGGALAWLAHLLLSYALAEFGCESTLAASSYLGMSAVAWGLLALTPLTIMIALASALLARRNRALSQAGGKHSADFVARAYAAHAGFIANAAFAVVILIESVPILYYLRQCN